MCAFAWTTDEADVIVPWERNEVVGCDNVQLEFSSLLFHRQHADFGKRSSIGVACVFDGNRRVDMISAAPVVAQLTL